MASSPFLPILLILYIAPHLPPSLSAVDLHPPTHLSRPSPYLSPTFFKHYNAMLSSFKIFPYPHPLNLTGATAAAAFHAALLSSPFATADPAAADLFYLPLPPDIPSRRLDRLIGRLRSSLPFWNRSLAADHFFLSSGRAAAASSARNVVELRKNAVRLAAFPSPPGHFVPHKDISLPPLNRFSLNRTRPTKEYKYLGFLKLTRSSDLPQTSAGLIEGLRGDPEFNIKSQPSDEDGEAYVDSRFCLFLHEGEVEGLGAALAQGCVPAVITGRPIQDMPLMDVLRWQEMALFVGAGVGPEGLKRRLKEVTEKKYERMRGLGAAAAHHFRWNDPPQPYDAFHMVVYQLWRRRHAVRYATWESR